MSEVQAFTDGACLGNPGPGGWAALLRAKGSERMVTADKKPVKNQDLWQRLSDAASTHKVRWQWVKGHNGHAENERVDQAAREQAELMKANAMKRSA
jgi:ribonuclease HI